MNKNKDIDMYMTNLLVETLPKTERTAHDLHGLGVTSEGSYIAMQLILSRPLKNIINGKSEEEAIIWKKEFHERLIKGFTTENIEVISILNLQPIVRTFVVKVSNNISVAKAYKFLREAFQQLNEGMISYYQTEVIGCFGTIVDAFFSIGKSYKKAREIQEYHYIVGLGKCTFFDISYSEDQFTLVEYKHLHFFDELLLKEEWISVFDVLETIRISLIDNKINDSKTMYIYKEIFSSTIRYLFKQPEKYKKEIQILNEGIIRFEHLFDDVNEIQSYYMTVFNAVSHIDLYNGLHPYIKKTLHIIHTRYSEPINLESVADELDISFEYLSRLFKKEMNFNFKKYLTNYRLQKAKEQLTSTSKDVNYIREAVGYQSRTQFIRAFKASEGMTPSRYRQLSR